MTELSEYSGKPYDSHNSDRPSKENQKETLSPVECICHQSTASLEVFNPTGETEIIALHAPRLTTLDGKKIGMISNESWQAHRTLMLIGKLLREWFLTIDIVPHTELPSGIDAIDSEETADILASQGCQGVIIGNCA